MSQGVLRPSPSMRATWRVLALAGLALTRWTSGFVVNGVGGTQQQTHRADVVLHARRRTASPEASVAILEAPASAKRRGRRSGKGLAPAPVTMAPADVQEEEGLHVWASPIKEEARGETGEGRGEDGKQEFSEQELATRRLITMIQRGQIATEVDGVKSRRTFTPEQLSAIRDGQQAQVELLELYKPLYKSVVYKYVKVFRSGNVNVADLETEAQAALIDAANRFDLSRSNKFTVLAAVQSQLDFVKTPSSLQRQRSMVKKFQREYTQQNNGNMPTIEEAAASLNLSPARVEYLSHFNPQAVKLERQMSRTGERMVDMILDPGMQSSLSGYINTRLSSRIDEAMEKLTEEEATVLTARLGLRDGQPKSLEEIRMEVFDGCSLQYLKKVEARAKQHLMRDLDLIKFVNDQLPKLESLDKTYAYSNSPLIRVRR